jgi:hypothetical protein
MATAAPKAPPLTVENGAPKARMSLDSIMRTIEPKPDRILLVGTEGVGKTTFAAEAPSPIFICAEDGLPPVLGEVPRFPTPESLADVLDAIRTLIREQHEFRTFVIDTIDWLEPVIWRELCTRNGWQDIESPGYGKGYVAAAEEWRKLLGALDVLRQRKGMEVILLAHAAIRTFQNPAGGDYSRYEAKLNKNACALVKEWTDTNLFAIHEEFVRLDKGKETRKGVSTGRRVIHTERTAAWDAKNRYALPPELPLCYADYAAARAAGMPASVEELQAEAEQLLGQLALNEQDTNQTKRAIEVATAKGAAHLARVVDRLRTKVTEKGEV